MNIDFNNLDVKRKINLMAEICHYGIEWNCDVDEDGHLANHYILGGVETTAHIISCCIVQWLGFESCGTGEVREGLFMQDAIEVKAKHRFTIEKWEHLIEQFLRSEITGENP